MSFWTPDKEKVRQGGRDLQANHALLDAPSLLRMQEVLIKLRHMNVFESAAEQMLAALLERVGTFAQVYNDASEGKQIDVLRITLYVRAEQDFRAIISLEEDGSKPTQEVFSSMTMWRWIKERQKPLWMDTTLGLLSSFEDDEVVEFDDLTGGSEEVSGHTSLLALLQRDATHMVLLPVSDLDGDVCGMVVIESCCEQDVGLSGMWSGENTQELLLWVDLYSPKVLSLLDDSDDVVVDDLAKVNELQDQWLPVVGESMRRRMSMLQAFASQDETLLLVGETGVGKSRLARWCHERSSRQGSAFEVIDLSSIPESMQIAHLTGWRRGAFTGAVQDVQGALERARGGTLFIDEVDKLSLETQASLLQLLETGQFSPLGARGGLKLARVRFIVGTNVDLMNCVRSGTFRQDLYYRICVLPMEIPALRGRRDEIVRWASYMFARALGSTSQQKVEIPDDVKRALESRSWPGNLRQLDNLVRRVVALSGGHRSLATRGSFVVDSRSVEQALEMEGEHQGVGPGEDLDARLLQGLERVSRDYISLALKRLDEGGMNGLHVDMLEAVKGLAYERAFVVGRDRMEGLSLLGKEQLAKHRNDRRAMAKELQKVDELRENLKKNH